MYWKSSLHGEVDGIEVALADWAEMFVYPVGSVMAGQVIDAR